MIKDLKVFDIWGWELFVVMVFVYVIKYFKDYLLYYVEWVGFGILKNDDICWVLIVLVIWDNGVKIVMWEVVIKVLIINIKNMNLN